VEERAPAARTGGARGPDRAGPPPRPVPLRDVAVERVPRLSTGIGELDRVLGGGLVPGSLVLLGGSPGIGKSTLTNMALGHLAGAGRPTLYVSGEESAAQIRLRAARLPGKALDVPVLAETDLPTVLATLEHERPDVCVIDSVQTLHAPELTGAPGSVGQVREVAGRIMETAKRASIAVLIFSYNLVRSYFRGANAGDDPWDAWTLEWSIPSPPPEYNFAVEPVVRSRRPLWDLKHPEDPDWRYDQ